MGRFDVKAFANTNFKGLYIGEFVITFYEKLKSNNIDNI